MHTCLLAFDLATSIKKTRIIERMIPATSVATCLVSIYGKSQSIDIIGSPILFNALGPNYNQLYV